jgi:hypothetical protein
MIEIWRFEGPFLHCHPEAREAIGGILTGTAVGFATLSICFSMVSASTGGFEIN